MHSASGYQRGEGCGAVFVKLFQGDRQDEEDCYSLTIIYIHI